MGAWRTREAGLVPNKAGRQVGVRGRDTWLDARLGDDRVLSLPVAGSQLGAGADAAAELG